MATFEIPVSYEMVGYVEVEAETKEEAFEIVDSKVKPDGTPFSIKDVGGAEYTCDSWYPDESFLEE